MKKLEVTAVDIAKRFIGVKEINGVLDNPMILAMLQLDQSWPQNDETPWCSAFVNYICWLLGLPRSMSLAARSWLLVGKEIKCRQDVSIGFDVIILNRGDGEQPDATVINAPGHVGFFDGFMSGKIRLLAGNQNNQVNVTEFSMDRILGIRRLFE